MTQSRTYVTLVLKEIPNGNSGWIRFVAPGEGGPSEERYRWRFTTAEFVYQTVDMAPASHTTVVPPGITAGFPAGIPVEGNDGGSTLIWMPAMFYTVHTYGIAIPIEVPSRTPTATSNAFFFEMGFNSSSAGGRRGAAMIEAPPVRALKNAAIDYTTTIFGRENQLQMSLETVTFIPEGGGIEISAPCGFVIDSVCDLVPVLDPTAPPPPPLDCTSVVHPEICNTGQYRRVIRLSARRNGLEPALHKFALVSENPKLMVENFASGATSCGTSICWPMGSFEHLAQGVQPTSHPLDLATSAQGFGIKQKMLEATIPSLTEEQRRSTNRDDRPLRPNSVIFAFKLLNSRMESATLLLRGPYGFEFHQECLPGLETSEVTVFGQGVRFPQIFDVWPAGVTVTDCLGKGSDAYLTLTVEPGYGLIANKLYLFRIAIKANPLVTPLLNRWNIELENEASEAIDGMTLWAFTRTSVSPVTTARARTAAGAIRTKNPLTINIRPFNTIYPGGSLRAEAPEDFEFVSLPSRECSVQLQELPYTELGLSYEGYVWPQEGLVCLVDSDDRGKLNVRLRHERNMNAGRDYELILTVYNPGTVLVGLYPITVWKISSYQMGSLSLDESRISAFRLNSVMNLWTYKNPDPNDDTREITNGGERLPAFSLVMRFPDKLVTGDVIRITAPPTFVLTDASGRCRGFRWVSNMEVTPEDWSPLPNSHYACDQTNMSFHITEPGGGIPKDTAIEFGLEIYNPLRTPNEAVAFWTCTHLSRPSDIDGTRTIKSSKAFQTWNIIPQFEGVEATLVGRPYAAESVSAMRVAFTAVTSAEDLSIQVTYPPSFSFGGVTTDDSDQEVFLTSGNMVRIRMAIIAGQRINIILRNVLLGQEGGQTDIHITSYTGGMFQAGVWVPGSVMDQKLNFQSGFRLPGQVFTKNYVSKLENNFIKDPQKYPVQSLWWPHCGRPAYIEFNFHITQPALAGEFLLISGAPFEPSMQLFTLMEAITGLAATSSTASASTQAQRMVEKEVVSIYGGVMRARLLEPLVPYRIYQLVLSVIAPHAQAKEDHGRPITWTLETDDGGMLPKNTNDAVSRVFTIVEEYDFQVTSPRAPPTAEVEVAVHFTPGIKAPTELRLVAPLLFTFPGNCLVHGGEDVTGCVPGKPLPNGRNTARLICNELGISSKPRDLRIRVNTPRAPPADQTWFVEGVDVWREQQLGWGMAAGVNVQPMADLAMAYPGIPAIRAFMVWRFRTQVMVGAGGYLAISLPAGFNPDCRQGNLKAISFPITGGCDDSNPENVIVYLNSTIVPAEYVFAFYVSPPTETPIRNLVSITLNDRFGQVKDAAVDLIGMPIQEKLRIRTTPLHWTLSKPRRPTMVTIGFEAVEPLPDLIVAPLQQVSEILITMPLGFQHLVDSPTEFTMVNMDMPLKDGDWLDYMQKDRLRIILNLNRTSWTTLKVGTYLFRFNAMVPDPLPAFNVWHLALCSPTFPGGCSKISDPAVLITYAIPGFNLNEKATVSPGFGIGATSHADRRVSTSQTALLTLLMLHICVSLVGKSDARGV